MVGDRQKKTENAIALSDRLAGLAGESLDLVERALNDAELSPCDRAEVALKLLELAGVGGRSNRAEESEKSAKNSIILYPNFVQIDDFLPPDEWQELLGTVLKNSDQSFTDEAKETEVEEIRKSSFLSVQNFDDFYQKLQFKILKIRLEILDRLNLPHFLVSRLEMQMTAHNNGEYYHIYRDVEGEKNANRVLSYAYYFYREPKAFYGGDLRLYETHIEGEEAEIGTQFKTVELRNNSIVFFDSRFKYELLPVFCPSQQFEDGRFTVSGWINR